MARSAASDSWSGAIATFKAASTSGLTLTGTAAANYTLAGMTGSVVITPKNLTAGGLVAPDRDYDGTTAAVLSGTAALPTAEAPGAGTAGDGMPYIGDDLTLGGAATGTFADKHVGDNKAITVTGITLGGAQAGNYTFTQPAGLTANVTPLPLTVAAVSVTKTYDGSTDRRRHPDAHAAARFRRHHDRSLTGVPGRHRRRGQQGHHP